MSVAQCRAARRKNRLRYGGARRKRNISESIAEERRKAAKAANMTATKPKK